MEKQASGLKGRQLISFEYVVIYLLVAVTVFLVIKHFDLKAANHRLLRVDLQSEKIKNRVLAGNYAEQFEGRLFPVAQFKEGTTKSLFDSFFPDQTIVILFSSRDCHPCLNQELRNYERIFGTTQGQTKIIAIASEPSTGDLLLVKKVNQITFPMWYDENDVISAFVPENKYPLVILIDRQRVVRAFFPIPGDNEYSTLNLSVFKRFLDNS